MKHGVSKQNLFSAWGNFLASLGNLWVLSNNEGFLACDRFTHYIGSSLLAEKLEKWKNDKELKLNKEGRKHSFAYTTIDLFPQNWFPSVFLNFLGN